MFPKRSGGVYLGNKKIGKIGVVHPEVLGNFHIKHVVTLFEVGLEDLFAFFKGQ